MVDLPRGGGRPAAAGGHPARRRAPTCRAGWAAASPSACTPPTSCCWRRPPRCGARRGPTRSGSPGSFLEQRHATMDRDGENWADWTIDGPARCSATTASPASPSASPPSAPGWPSTSAPAPTTPRPPCVLRRASVIAMGRGLDMDAWTHPDDARPADESCHTYHAGVVPVSFRNVGSFRHERGRRCRRADPRRRRPGPCGRRVRGRHRVRPPAVGHPARP